MDNPWMPTSPPSKEVSGKPSRALVEKLRSLTPQEREQAIKVAAKLLTRKAMRTKPKP